MVRLLLFLIISPASVAALRLNKGEEPALKQKICDTPDESLCYDEDGEQIDDGADAIADSLQVTSANDLTFKQKDLETEVTLDMPADRPCPLVYVYDLQAPFQDEPQLMNVDVSFGYKIDNTAQAQQVAGTHSLIKAGSGDFRHTNQFSLSRIMANSLKSSNRCSTRDPSKADLFMVPLLASAKTASRMEEACKRINGKSAELLKALPHLNEQTAKKHFIAMGKSFYHVTCDGVYRNPKGLFAQMARVDVEAVLAGDLLNKIKEEHGYVPKQQLHSPLQFPRHYTLPYPSDFHGNNFHWTLKGERQTLASFVGSDAHGDTAVRKHITGGVCHKDKVKCMVFAVHGDHRIDAHAVKSDSVFCFEPVGDSLGRKSIGDSYAAGCIPVFFGNGTPLQYQFLFKGWEKDAYIIFDRPKYLKNEIDVYKELSSISDERILEMRKAIKANGHKLLYRFNVNQVDEKDDAVTMFVKKLAWDTEHAQ